MSERDLLNLAEQIGSQKIAEVHRAVLASRILEDKPVQFTLGLAVYCLNVVVESTAGLARESTIEALNQARSLWFWSLLTEQGEKSEDVDSLEQEALREWLRGGGSVPGGAE